MGPVRREGEQDTGASGGRTLLILCFGFFPVPQALLPLLAEGQGGKSYVDAYKRFASQGARVIALACKRLGGDMPTSDLRQITRCGTSDPWGGSVAASWSRCRVLHPSRWPERLAVEAMDGCEKKPARSTQRGERMLTTEGMRGRQQGGGVSATLSCRLFLLRAPLAAVASCCRGEAEMGLEFAGFAVFMCPVKPQSEPALAMLKVHSSLRRIHDMSAPQPLPNAPCPSFPGVQPPPRDDHRRRAADCLLRGSEGSHRGPPCAHPLPQGQSCGPGPAHWKV